MICIVLTLFDTEPELKEIHNVFTLRAEANPKIYYSKHFEIHTLELSPRRLKELFSNPQSQPEAQKQLTYWIDYLLNANRKTEAEMTALLEKAPGLAKTHELYTHFTASERRRERALARMKADLDIASQREFAYDEGVSFGWEQGKAEGEAIGLEKGEAIGVFKAKRDCLLNFLELAYSSQITQSVCNRILQIKDFAILDALLKKAFLHEPYEELVKML